MSNGWVWALVAVIAIIIIAAIIIIILVAIESRDVDKPCTSDTDCDTGLVCVSGRCKKENGQICEFSDQCASGICSDEFRCVSGTGPLILLCTSDSECSPGEKCDTTTGKCLSGFRGDCLVSSDCFYKPSVCTGPSGGGQKICLVTSGGTCANNNDCLSGTCTKAVGESLGRCAVGTLSSSVSFTPVTINNNTVTSSPQVGFTMIDTDTISTMRTNPTFNVESAPTRAEMVVDFRTPTPQEVDSPFKRIRRDMVMSRGNTKQSPVIDVTSYSNAVLALMKDGNIIRETDDQRDVVANNIKLKRLESFNGTLYGISVDGRVFSLNNDTFGTRKWMWNLTSFPTGVIHTSATHDGRHFWVQTSTDGLLYDRKLRVKENVDMRGKKRVYGGDKDIYVEIDTQNNTATLQPNNETVRNVAGAVITHDNHLKTLKPSQTRLFSDIRLINWTPAYIKRSL